MSKRSFLTTLAFLAFISLGLPDGLLGVSWPSIRADFTLPLDRLGLLVAVTTAGYLAASFMSGAVMRRVPIGMVLAMSTLAAAIGLLGFALTPAWPLMIALGFLAGLGGGAVDAGLNAYGARHFSPQILNWLHAFFGLGTTIGPLLVSGVLGSGLVWQVSYAIVGSAQLVLAATFFVTRSRWEEVAEIGHDVAEELPAAPVSETLRKPVVWFGMLVFFVYCGIEVTAAQWSYTLLTLGRGFSETNAGLVIGLFWGSLTIGRIGFGFIANRVPLHKTLRICILAAALGALLFWLAPVPALGVLGLMMIGFFFAPIFASLISLTPGRVGREHANSAIGFQIAAAGLGGAVVTALTGLMTRSLGLEVIGIVVFAATVLLLVLYELFTRERRP
ncbi:fucose permease [Rhizobium sp. PP-CC-3A-592]|nr:fucose permease [Rhizobium sp. PP-CC-3A-592]